MTKKSTNPCLQYYGTLSQKMSELLKDVESNGLLAELTKAHDRINDLQLWLSALKTRREADILKVAFQEYDFALLCLVQGFYRQAFTSLRLFIELTLAAIQLSANELDLRMWFAGKKDTNWNLITDHEKGIFSPSFVEAFCPELLEHSKPILGTTKQVYRECSEFVHGNHAANKELPPQCTFSKDVCSSWFQKSENIFFVVQYALTLRYIHEISADDWSKLEPVLNEELGSLGGFAILLT